LKDRSNNFSSKVFVTLLITTILAMVSFIVWGTFASMKSNLSDLLGKVMVFMMVCWNLILIFYMSIAFKKEDDGYGKSKKINYVFVLSPFLINLLFVIFLDFKTNKLVDNGLYVMGGALNHYVNIMGFASILYAVVVMIIYRKRLDALTKLIGLIVSLIALFSIVIGASGIMPLNDMCFLHTLVIMFLYLSLEGQDRNLLNEFNVSIKSAEESNKLKSEFIMNMSHQLRTPMNTIFGFTDSLLTNENLTQEIFHHYNNQNT
jgi:signal transduction histidine kinase